MAKGKWSEFKRDLKQIVKKFTNLPPGAYGYLYLALIPLCSVIFFVEIMSFGENPEQYGPLELPLRNLVDSIYFSIITITTLGYGDITPLTIIGKITSALEALSGIALIGLFLNALSHQYANEAQEEERKVMRKELRDELVGDFERIATEVKESSQELVNQVTGGDSFPLIELHFSEEGINFETSVITVSGDYPMHYVTGFVFGLGIESFDSVEQLEFTALMPSICHKLGLEGTSDTKKEFSISAILTARNGMFTQNSKYIRTNTGFEWKTSVKRASLTSDDFGKSVEVFSEERSVLFEDPAIKAIAVKDKN